MILLVSLYLIDVKGQQILGEGNKSLVSNHFAHFTIGVSLHYFMTSLTAPRCKKNLYVSFLKY